MINLVRRKGINVDLMMHKSRETERRHTSNGVKPSLCSRVRRSPPLSTSVLSSSLLHSVPSLRPNGLRGGPGRHLSQVAVDVWRLLLFFTGHRPFLMTPQTRGSTSSGDTLHCSFWSLNPQGFIYTRDENRMCSTDLRRGGMFGGVFGRQTSCWLFFFAPNTDSLIF